MGNYSANISAHCSVFLRLWMRWRSPSYWIRLGVFFCMLCACACAREKAVWDQTCPLHCYTNTKRTNSKWHLNWSRWKALWTGSKGWYFHAGVKTNPLPLLLSLPSLSSSCTFGPKVSAFLALLLRPCTAYLSGLPEHQFGRQPLEARLQVLSRMM